MKDRIWPKAHRADRLNGLLVLDSRGMADGYIFAAVSQKVDKRLKLGVKKDSDIIYYDLNKRGEFELMPLQFGNGKYDFQLYINREGDYYNNAGLVSLYVKLKNPEAPFLIPNQFVNYSEDTSVVKIADDICKDLDKEAAFEKICRYVESRYIYDQMKALNVKPGTLPDIETTQAKRMGICQDFAAITVAMLRSQGIPAKLIVGRVGLQRHAWVMVFLNGEYKRYDPTAKLVHFSPKAQYISERTY